MFIDIDQAQSFTLHDYSHSQPTDRRIIQTSRNNTMYQVEKLLVMGKKDDSVYGDEVTANSKGVFKGRNTVAVASNIMLGSNPENLLYCALPTSKVVIKSYSTIHEESAMNETFINRYIHSLPKNDNIAEYIETAYDSEQDSFYFISKMYSGPDLFDYLAEQERGLDEFNAAKLFMKIINGMEFLHENGVAHRDLSAMNIILDGPDNLRIIDFEMAKYDEHRMKSIPYTGSAGTLKYMAPEIYEQQSTMYDPFAADIWSLGVILFFILVRSEIYEAPTLSDIRYKHLTSGRLGRMLKQWNIKMSDEALDLIQSMLRYHPSQRISLHGIKNHPWILKRLGNRVKNHASTSSPLYINPLTTMPYTTSVY